MFLIVVFLIKKKRVGLKNTKTKTSTIQSYFFAFLHGGAPIFAAILTRQVSMSHTFKNSDEGTHVG